MRSDLDVKNEAADPEVTRLIDRYAEGLKRPASERRGVRCRGSVTATPQAEGAVGP
jgi:hypothetical protein